MNEINYERIIDNLEFRKAWTPLRICLEISAEQYIALFEYFVSNRIRGYGLIYNQMTNYFYSYRSGFVLGKYRVVKQQNGNYSFTELYMNLYKEDSLIIFDFIIDACRQNHVGFDGRKMFDWRSKTNSLNTDIEHNITYDLGPQSPSDNPFTAKARMLQSLWCVQNGLEMGIGPNKNSVDRRTGLPTYYGNIIKDGESNGRNFFYPETFEYAKWRVKTKLKDETIDEYRLFNNLMSSMPMAFNLFHPLMMLHAQNPAAVDKMMQHAFPDLPIYKIKEIGLEYIPTPIEHYTNDKSAMDAFISFYDKEGGEHIIAIETKYTDSLGTNKAKDITLKTQFAIESGLFTEEGIHQIKTNCIQIYRNFLLVEKFRVVNRLKDSYSIILAPKDHPSTEKEINSLKKYLKNEYNYKLADYKLEDFVCALKLNCPVEYMDWLEWFEDRYLRFEKMN